MIVENKSLLSFPVTFESVEDIADGRFTKVKIYMMHTGLNYNKTVFEKDVVENAIPTLEYIPIVGFIKENQITGEKDFSGHEYIIIKNEDGTRRKYIGHGYGVIKSSNDNNAHFEKRICDDGIEREFLCVDGLLWNCFEDSSNIINNDVIKKHSMELYEKNVNGYEDDNGNFHFTDFSFKAACILGDDKSPAMINSTIELQYTFDNLVNNIQDEIIKKYNEYVEYINQNEGGKDVMPENKEQVNDFTLSLNQQIETISKIVCSYGKWRDEWGYEYPKYYFVDIQDNEVIVIDTEEDYHYYAFPFVVNGDFIVVDFNTKIRKKISYEDFEDNNENDVNVVFSIVNDINNNCKENYSKIESLNKEISDLKEEKSHMLDNYTNLKNEYDKMQPKYDEYVKAEQIRQENELREQKNREFERFEQALGNNEDFIALKNDIDNLTVEDINSKCSILFTRLSLENKLTFTQNNNAMTVGLENESDELDGYVATKYGNIPVN